MHPSFACLECRVVVNRPLPSPTLQQHRLQVQYVPMLRCFDCICLFALSPSYEGIQAFKDHLRSRATSVFTVGLEKLTLILASFRLPIASGLVCDYVSKHDLVLTSKPKHTFPKSVAVGEWDTKTSLYVTDFRTLSDARSKQDWMKCDIGGVMVQHLHGPRLYETWKYSAVGLCTFRSSRDRSKIMLSCTHSPATHMFHGKMLPAL